MRYKRRLFRICAVSLFFTIACIAQGNAAEKLAPHSNLVIGDCYLWHNSFFLGENLLTFLPSEFTKDELAKLLIDKGKRSSATQILNMWEARGYVERLNELRGLYKKIC